MYIIGNEVKKGIKEVNFKDFEKKG